ncbi:MAG TPA: type IV pilus assembly protein PilM [Gaiellaceae bacterium]|nr:type IV pilus assembly protein PilM [Gaiellaceae bacterium]
MSGLSDLLKKDLSFKRKPKAEAAAPTQAKPATDAPKDEAPKRAKPSLPKRAPKQPKSTTSSGGGRHKQVVGLSVGASQLSAAVVVNNGRPKLVKAATHTLPPEVVVGGEVRDSEALANEISAFFSAADLPRKNVRLGIGSSRTGVRVFERPTVDDPRQLANAIRFRAYETLPIPIEEAMLDYHIVEDTNSPDRVLLAVAYRDLVDRFAATCTAAKIELVGIDIEAFALLRAVGGEPLKAGERAEAARVAVSIGSDRTTVAVSDGRLCEFTRVLDWGGARVTAAIERALEVDAGEAERLKRSLDISTRATEEPGDERTTKAVEAARREVNGLARELASSLHFYQDQPDSLGFAEITVTGGGAHLQGLAEQLEELIGIHVRVADPFARVGSGHGISSNGQDGALAVAIGLGIED